jgi:hypothetical protein
MSSSFLENLMRSGAETYNAKVTLSGTTVTIGSYGVVPYSEINPLLVRFNSSTTCVYSGPALSIDFSTVDWELSQNDGSVTLYVGLMYVNNTTVIPTLSLYGESGTVAANDDPRKPETFSTVPTTGLVIPVAKVMNVERVNGWVTTNSWIEE